jgi:streptogramin lyase
MPMRVRRTATAIVGVVTSLLLTPALGHAQATRSYDVPDANADINSLVVGPDGHLWFAEQNGYALRSISPQGQFRSPGRRAAHRVRRRR